MGRKSSPPMGRCLLAASVTAALTITGCGGGSGSTGSPDTPSAGTPLAGSAVKGPLTFASAALYQLDSSATDLKGVLLDTGTTDSKAAIEGLIVPSGAEPPFLLEFTATDQTRDLSTGARPVLARLSTVVTASMLAADSGLARVYATPMTTLAVELTGSQLQSGATTGGLSTDASLEERLAAAAGSVASSLGFGMAPEVDIFTTPPMLDDSVRERGQFQAVAQYRMAGEALAAVVTQIAGSGGDASAVLKAVADDLSDGLLDGQKTGRSGGREPVTLIDNKAIQVIQSDPQALMIPGTDKLVTSVTAVLTEESAVTREADAGTLIEYEEAFSGLVLEPTVAELDPDRDDDGVFNRNDAFPDDPSETLDSDGDGIGNNADPDDDNDGVVDGEDAFPLDGTESLDSDGDGIGNNADTDDDNDGVIDGEDQLPLDGSEQVDTDGDGIGNNSDTDDDNDGVADSDDAFPLDASETLDSDGDGIGNNADKDDDNDTVFDSEDAFPLDMNESVDTDGDGIGNNADTDDDGDGLLDEEDSAPLEAAGKWDQSSWGQFNWN